MTPADKLRIIRALATLRTTFRAYRNDDARAGFRSASLVYFWHIEATVPSDELWTSLPPETELTDNHRIGDHLAVTRTLLGFTT